MKKILTIVLVSAFAIVLSTGCGGTSAKPADEDLDAKVSKDALYVHTYNNKTVINAIKRAAQKSGWDITEFKSNEVIAEKTDDGQTISSSIKFSNGHIEFEDVDATSNLRDAIEDELSSKNNSH